MAKQRGKAVVVKTPEELRKEREKILREKGQEFLRYVNQYHQEKGIPKERIFRNLSEALQQAAERVLGPEPPITITIDHLTGLVSGTRGSQVLDPEMMDDLILKMGRIQAQLVKQSWIQKNREAECQSVYDDFKIKSGKLVRGTVTRVEPAAALIALGKTEAILPRSEQIQGQSLHVHETIKAVIMDVRKNGSRVKVVLSRCHPDFVRALFEEAIPEIRERTIEIKSVAREAGQRSKIAVSSIDMKVDAVGACVGVRGSRIKDIIDELGGERIDIVRWNQSTQVMIENALQPATIDDVIMHPLLGRVIVQVAEDQLSLAIGRRGQNVRLASKLVGWDIEIMTVEEHSAGIEKAIGWFAMLPHITETGIERLIEEGFLAFEDLTLIEIEQLAELLNITYAEAREVVEFAEEAQKRVDSGEDLSGNWNELEADSQPATTEIQTETQELPEQAVEEPTAQTTDLPELSMNDETSATSSEIPANQPAEASSSTGVASESTQMPEAEVAVESTDVPEAAVAELAAQLRAELPPS